MTGNIYITVLLKMSWNTRVHVYIVPPTSKLLIPRGDQKNHNRRWRRNDNAFPPAPDPGVRPTPCSRTSRPQPVRGNASVATTFPAEVIWSASTGVQVCAAPPRARGTGRAERDGPRLRPPAAPPRSHLSNIYPPRHFRLSPGVAQGAEKQVSEAVVFDVVIFFVLTQFVYVFHSTLGIGTPAAVSVSILCFYCFISVLT